MTPEALAVAREYVAAPVHSPVADEAWRALMGDVERAYERLSRSLSFRRTDNPDYYPDAASVFADVATGKLYVSDRYLKHPLWTPAENWRFRGLHDVLGHVGAGSDFSIEGERAAYLAQLAHVSDRAQPALQVEVYGQSAACGLLGRFDTQRVYLPAEVIT